MLAFSSPSGFCRAILFAAVICVALLTAVQANDKAHEYSSKSVALMFDRTCVVTGANYDRSLSEILSSDVGWKETDRAKVGGEIRSRTFIAGDPSFPFAAAVTEADLPEFAQVISYCVVGGPAIPAEIETYFLDMGARLQTDRSTTTDRFYQIVIDGNLIQLSSSFKGPQFALLHATDYPDDITSMWLPN